MHKCALCIPCYNEEQTIGKVIDDFRRVMPELAIYVCDNASTDKTAETARAHGATVLTETRQGKGYAMRTLFARVQAETYLLVDGDDTYPAEAATALLQPILDHQADMTVGDRLSQGVYAHENKRRFHNMGNRLVLGLVNRLFKARLKDIMSGYRAYSRAYIKTLPIMSPGFQIETEMTLHTLDKRLKIVEIPVEYRDRPPGSVSKLNTMRDGFRVLSTIVSVFRDYRPLLFFGLVALLFLAAGLAVGIPVIGEFIRTHFVSLLPSAVLAMGFVLTAMLCLSCGLILDTIGRHHRKQFELAWLARMEADDRDQ